MERKIHPRCYDEHLLGLHYIKGTQWCFQVVHIEGLPSSHTKCWGEKKTGRRGCVRHNQCLASWHWQPSPLALLLHKEGRASFFFNCTTEDAPPSTPSKGGYQEGFIREWNKKRNLASSSAFLSDDQNFQKPKEEICQKWWAPEDFETAPDLEFRIYPSMSSFFAKSLIANPYFHLFPAF